MKQDIKEMVKKAKEENVTLSKNHEKNFEALLQSELHPKTKNKSIITWFTVAASVALILTFGLQLQNSDEVEIPKSKVENISLGSISPEFQTLETYYTNSIKLEISEIDLDDNNKDLVDSYLLKIGELTKEYKSLTLELNTKGVNDATIDALISNLQLRLQLLKRLRKQLKELKNLNTKQNELQII